MTKVVIVDNFDSFVYNIAQYAGALGADVSVIRNDSPLGRIEQRNPDHIILSPGPGHPRNARVTNQVIKHLDVPILGICLGHQAIGYVLGADVLRGAAPVHGKASLIKHDGQGIFRDVPNPLRGTRYHSLVIDPESLPDELRVIARSGQEIMGIEHRRRTLIGLQFHPESILTQSGRLLLRNFLEM